MSTTLENLLSKAQQRGVKLWLKGGQLHYRLPTGGAEQPVFAEIRRRKHEVITYLQARSNAPLCIPDLEVQPRPPHLPLSFAQERLWVVEQLGLAGAAYNMASAQRLHGELDLHALRLSLQEIVRRHEILRTRLETLDGLGCQVVEPAGPVAMEVRDLSALGAQARELEAQRIIRAAYAHQFVLTQAPLFRVLVLKISLCEHVLFFLFHHIISDNWSQQVLERELASLYSAYREGRPSPLPALPLQYADFALWQRSWLQAEALERLLGYWKERLAGMPSSLDLPTDRARPPVAVFRGAQVRVNLATPLAGSLLELARGRAATLYMVLLAAFQILLARLSGQNDVAVGSPISGRTDRQTQGLIGFFVNTLVMRTDLSGDPSFSELLSRVQKSATAAYVHQDLPFEKLVAELQSKRDLSRQPLVQVMFALDKQTGGNLELPGLRVEPEPAYLPTAKVDLLLTLVEGGHGIQGAVEYAADLFEASTIERYVQWYERLLEQIVADPHRPLSQLRLLNEAEWDAVVMKWNRTQREYPAASVMELIERHAQEHPEWVALVSGEERVSYGELEARSNQLAHFLREAGVDVEVVVGVYLDLSVEQVVSLLGILKAGGAYLPLDVSHPAERVQYMLSDAGAKLVLTQERLLGRVTGAGVRAVCLDREELGSAPRSGVEVKVHAEQLAYVIYTPGSTGQPKGVCATHENLRYRVAAQEGIAPYGEQEVSCQKSSIGLVDAVYEVLVPLSQGGQLVVMSEQVGRSARELLQEAERCGVSRWVTVPSLAASLLQSEDLQPRRRLRGLRHWTLSGEALRADLMQRLCGELPGCRFVNVYGSSEVSADAVAYVVRGQRVQSMPIGRPLANAQVYVLDEQLQPVPVGMAGELYIGGAGLSRGYVRQPGQTAQRFVANPFGPAGSRLYRTGDRVRYTAEADLEYLGRRDHQVKLRGYRIELEEIESRLRTHEAVHDAAVVLHEAAVGEAQLVAYYVAVVDREAETGALKAHLRESLPGYMVPEQFVELEQLPVTPSGKLDRRALPEPTRALQSREYVAPRTPTEQVLARIWAEVLEIERVSVHDNFFELGGHSLLAMRVIARLRAEFAKVPLRVIFEQPLLHEMAKYMSTQTETDEEIEVGII